MMPPLDLSLHSECVQARNNGVAEISQFLFVETKLIKCVGRKILGCVVLTLDLCRWSRGDLVLNIIQVNRHVAAIDRYRNKYRPSF